MGIKAVYLDNRDGKHPTAEDAERTNKLYSAVEKFDEAKHAICRNMVNGATSADGVPFSEIGAEHMYCIHKPWGSMPRISEHWIWLHYGVEVDIENGRIAFRESSDRNGRTVYLDELYRFRKNAEKQLKSDLREWLADQKAQVEKLLERMV